MAGRFSLTLTSRTNHRPIEDIVVSIYLGKTASSVSATATGDKRPLGAVGGAGGAGRKEDADGWVGGGTWEFDPHTQVSHLDSLKIIPYKSSMMCANGRS